MQVFILIVACHRANSWAVSLRLYNFVCKSHVSDLLQSYKYVHHYFNISVYSLHCVVSYNLGGSHLLNRVAILQLDVWVILKPMIVRYNPLGPLLVEQRPKLQCQ